MTALDRGWLREALITRDDSHRHQDTTTNDLAYRRFSARAHSEPRNRRRKNAGAAMSSRSIDFESELLNRVSHRIQRNGASSSHRLTA